MEDYYPNRYTAVPSAKYFPTHRPWRKCVLDASKRNCEGKQPAIRNRSENRSLASKSEKMKTTEGLEVKASDVARKHKWFNCVLSADHGNIDADVESKLRRGCSVLVLPEAMSTDVDKLYRFQVLLLAE